MSAVAWLHIVWLVLICAIGDVFFKRAAALPRPFTSGSFIVGSLIYGLCGFSWVIVLQTAKLATSGVLFSVLWSVSLAICGLVLFGEHLTTREMIGFALGVVSLVLLNL
ncbi:MAG: hypothetical protein K1X78_10150 [Verrucomicrobiaceae bacterium]|nr:hypothetical protein [Verrucomicrobiaceae bacterium]